MSPTDLEKAPKTWSRTEASPSPVDWEGPHDPAKPTNWPSARRWSMVMLMTCMSHTAGLAATIFAPAVPQLMDEFQSQSAPLASLVVSIYVAGFGLGPLFSAPLSELYGRLPVIYASNVAFLALTIACGACRSLGGLIALRILAGVAGATPLTLGGSIVADLMSAQKRPPAMSLWSVGTLMGPIIGPVVGGYAGQALGWRWMFWLVCILEGLILIASPVILRESYAPLLLRRKARKLDQCSNGAMHGTPATAAKESDGPVKVLARALLRPSKLLVKSNIVAILAFQTAIAYAYGYLLFTTFTLVFQGQYHFQAGEVGLTYMGLGVGFLVTIIYCNFYATRLARRRPALMAENPDKVNPEQQLKPLLVGAILLPVGLLWYGWTAQYHTHFMLPIMGTTIIGAGIIATWLPIQLYLIETNPLYAASALATNTIVRSLVGGVVPICGDPMYQRLGLGWGNTLLAAIAAIMILVPLGLQKYGKAIRESEKLDL